MKCQNCGNNKFLIERIEECDSCEHNGAQLSTDSPYIYDADIIISEKLKGNDIERDQVEYEGECNMGTAYGDGCYMIKCLKCGHLNHIPIGFD